MRRAARLDTGRMARRRRWTRRQLCDPRVGRPGVSARRAAAPRRRSSSRRSAPRRRPRGHAHGEPRGEDLVADAPGRQLERQLVLARAVLPAPGGVGHRPVVEPDRAVAQIASSPACARRASSQSRRLASTAAAIRRRRPRRCPTRVRGRSPPSRLPRPGHATDGSPRPRTRSYPGPRPHPVGGVDEPDALGGGGCHGGQRAVGALEPEAQLGLDERATAERDGRVLGAPVGCEEIERRPQQVGGQPPALLAVEGERVDAGGGGAQLGDRRPPAEQAAIPAACASS